jgi:hypothetical protein
MREPQRETRGGVASPQQELFEMITVDQLDAAVDRAARLVSGTVAVFLAAPAIAADARAGNCDRACIEFAIEFFVPPTEPADLPVALDRAISQRCSRYANARRKGEAVGPIVHIVAPGSFHQWQVAWRGAEVLPIAERWSAERSTLCNLLRQAEMGWRELLAL